VQTSNVVPTIVSLQEHLENIRQAEVERLRGRFGQITPEQEAAIDALTHGIINKILHTPITTLKIAARDQGEGPVVELIRRIFNLEDKSKATGNGSKD